jgi:two-component system response regulator DevR
VTLRVLVIDDHVIVREGLRRALGRDDSMRVVGEAASRTEAIAQISHHNPDVIVVDINLPDGSGLEVIAWARSLSQKIGIVALTIARLPEHILACLESGASAHVDKAAPLNELVSAIRQSAIAPLTFNSRKMTSAIALRNQRIGLTQRELELLERLTSGDSVRQLAVELFLSESTVKTHLGSIYRKLEVSNRVQAINKARGIGLLP